MFGKVGVTEDEAREYYDAHLSEFTTPPAVTLREILVAVPADAKARERRGGRSGARRRPRRSARASLAGESFEKLAAEVSDAPSKANGGLIGPLSASELSPELRKLHRGA